MKIKELIKLLQSYPQDMIVVSDCGPLNKDSLEIKEEYYNGDSANPKCEILKNVLYIS